MENGYSLSDIAAIAKDNDNFGGSAWVMIILFALIFGINGNGFGGANGGYDRFATAASQQEILFGQQFQGLDNKIDRIGNGIADATFALNNSVTTEGRSIQSQLADCCCKNQSNVDALRFDMSNYACETQKAIHAEGEATRNMLQQNKIESLQAQINNLQMQNAMAGVVRYPMSSAWAMNGNPFCGTTALATCGNV